MVSQKVMINYPDDLHIRPAGQLAKTAQKYSSAVYLLHNGARVDVKSMLALLGACIKFGDEVEFICEGEDEEQALADVLAQLDVEAGFLKINEKENPKSS